MTKFCKKPIVIEAIQFNGQNGWEIQSIAGDCKVIASPILEPTENNPTGHYLQIYTPEGVMTAIVGDWIIRGVNGELYPCKPDIFVATYEAIEP